jgi:hypothetical protein
MDDTATSTPGTLAKFHLGLAADGASCAMVFVDERQRSIACIAGFADLEEFISSLTQAAAEMARRRAALAGAETEDEEEVQNPTGAINVSAANFRICDEDGTILGSLIGDGGQVVGIRMRADVANEMTRNMLRTARVVSTC